MAEHGYNRAQLLGRLGQDPEVKQTQGGMSVLKLRLATTERVKKQDQWQDATEWHSVVLFGKRAEALGNILGKGDRVFVEGRLHTSSWEKDGQKKYRTEVIASDVVLCGGGTKPDEKREKPAASNDDIPF